MIKNNKIIVQKKNSKKKGNYYLKETIGEGAFAKVKLGIHIPTGEKVAIKILNKEHFSDDSSEKNNIIKIRKEINILKRIHHKNIIQLYEIMESSSNLYIIMEYCENKELFDYIISKKFLQEKEACRLFQQIIDGVEYLHLSNITHRDLKLENLLLDENYRIKITDFGLSYLGKNIDDLIETHCGTPSYAPPEMLRGEKYNGILSDIWSCGIILYTMLVGNLPCSESKEELVYENIMQNNYYFPENISKEAKDLIKNMLMINPKERYNFEQIKTHPWFNLVKPKLKPGIVYGVHKIPIDNYILSRIEKYGYDKDKCKDSILNNNFDENCSIYYLTLKQIIREKKSSISDLFSEEYIEYLKDYKNWINVDEITNPLFINYHAEIPIEINKEKTKNNVLKSLIEKNINNDNSDVIKKKNYSLSAKANQEKNIRIFDNEIELIKNENKQNSQKILNNNDETFEENNISKEYEKKAIINPKSKKKFKKRKKVIKNISFQDSPDIEIKNLKFKNITNKSSLRKKSNLKKRKNEKSIDKNKLNYSEVSENIFNQSAKARKKHIILDIIENNNYETNKVNHDKKEKKYSKVKISKNKLDKQRNNLVIQTESLNKLNKLNKIIDISKTESPKDDYRRLSLYSKMFLSPKAFSSLNNESYIHDINETTKLIELNPNKEKIKNKKSKKKIEMSDTDIDKLKEEEKIKLRNKLNNDENKFINEINIIDNITNDTTIDSINGNSFEENNNKNMNFNLIHLMARKMLKNSIFNKYLIKNKNKKKILKDDLENKFHTLQKYKDIIGLIEKVQNKIFKNKYTDFNYETFDEYLEDENDKKFSSLFLNKNRINPFIKKIKLSLEQKKKQKMKNYNKLNNIYLSRFQTVNNRNSIKERSKTEDKYLENNKHKHHLNLSYLTTEENKSKTKRIYHKNRRSNISKSSKKETTKKTFMSNKNIFSNKKTKEKESKINNINIKKTLDYDSDFNDTSNNNISLKNKTNITNNNSILKDNQENEQSFSSNYNYNSIDSKEDHGIYKKNKSIKTPQLGPKINNNKDNKNISKNNENEGSILDNIPLIIDTKNKDKEISIKDKEKFNEEIDKFSDKKIRTTNNKTRNSLNTNSSLKSSIRDNNKTNMTFSDNQINKIKNNFPFDLNCIINLPFTEIKSKIKSFFKKIGFFCTEKGNTIIFKKWNTNIEIIINKFDDENKFFYLSTKIKSKEIKKEKEIIKKLILTLNNTKK